MEFASKYCYVVDKDEEEVFDESKINDDGSESGSGSGSGSQSENELSDDEEIDKVVPQSRLRKVKKANPNVIALNLGSLADDTVAATGDVILCANCQAAFTEISKITNTSEGQLWKCEYCAKENIVNLDEEEIPKGDSVDYVIQPPTENRNTENDIVVFCIDTSGSMCITSELVDGEFKIKYNEKLSQNLNQFIENGADQFCPNEQRGVTYVSRLQCVQAAITSQIETLAKNSPDKRVALVTFNNDVTVHLPGKKKHVLTGDKLNDFDYLVDVTKKLNLSLDSGISDTEKEMIETVLSLEEGGATALGPAILVSIGIAQQAKGSSVILCTDGVANIGLGSLENLTEQNRANHPAPVFYSKLGQVALQKGIAVSVISIKGTNAVLEHIAKVAAETKGYNDIVDPLKLTKNFNFVLENKIIATDVNAVVHLHRSLRFKDESIKDKNTYESQVGNVVKESAVTFEYVIHDKEMIKDIQSLPFQVQIRYTKLDGRKCIRVLSKTINVTKDREVAEKQVNVNVVGLHAQKKAAQLATEGNYSKARMVQKANMRMVKRGIKENATDDQKKHLSLWTKEATRLNTAIKHIKKKEQKKGLRYNSCEDDFSDNESEESAEEESKEKQDKRKKKLTKKVERFASRQANREKEDDLSNVLYQAANPMYSHYTSSENPLYKNT